MDRVKHLVSVSAREEEFLRVLNLGLSGITLLPGEARKLAVRTLELKDGYEAKSRALFVVTCVALAEALLLITLP